MEARRAHDSGTAGPRRHTGGSLLALPSGSAARSRHEPHRHPRHPARRPATSTPGTARTSPEPSASGSRSTGSEHSRNAYRSRRSSRIEVAENCHKDCVTSVTGREAFRKGKGASPKGPTPCQAEEQRAGDEAGPNYERNSLSIKFSISRPCSFGA